SIPTAEAKEAVWASVVESDDLPNAVQAAVISGFGRARDRALLAPFAERYFRSIEHVWTERTNEMAQNIVIGLYPAKLADIDGTYLDVLARTDEFLDSLGDRLPALRRLVVEARDTARRALAAQARDRAWDQVPPQFANAPLRGVNRFTRREGERSQSRRASAGVRQLPRAVVCAGLLVPVPPGRLVQLAFVHHQLTAGVDPGRRPPAHVVLAVVHLIAQLGPGPGGLARPLAAGPPLREEDAPVVADLVRGPVGEVCVPLVRVGDDGDRGGRLGLSGHVRRSDEVRVLRVRFRRAVVERVHLRRADLLRI